MIDWVSAAIEERIRQFGLDDQHGKISAALIELRKVMNTEGDCFIQTPKRLIVIECKDKTDFKSEQINRQKALAQCLMRLFPRPEPLIYVEISSSQAGTRPNHHWTWKMAEEYQLGVRDDTSAT